MNVLIADKFDAAGVDEIRRLGAEVTCDPGLSDDKLRDAITKTGCAILVVRSTRVTAEMIEASDGLGLIIRAGAGYNTIDVAAASRRGVLVANCPGKNAVAVAELTFGLILALDRRIVDNVNDLRGGVWNKKVYATARGLKGRTLGVVGMGRIGQAVVRRARAFEMNVVAWSRSLDDERAEALDVIRCPTPADVAASCDILSIHLAAAPETTGIVNADVLGRLAPGSYVINTARHDVMDYKALATLAAERDLRVGLDVFPGEPSGGTGAFSDEFVQAGGLVYGTHHIGASTEQAQQAISAETVRIVREFITTGQAPNCVNLATKTPAVCQLVVRHYDKVGVLASVLDKLRRANINIEEMSNTVFQGQAAAVAAIRLDEMPKKDVLQAIADMKDMVIQVEAKPI